MTLIQELCDALEDVFDVEASAKVVLEIVRRHDAEKLDEMRLHDNTGDPRDEGYMEAISEMHDYFIPPGV